MTEPRPLDLAAIRARAEEVLFVHSYVKGVKACPDVPALCDRVAELERGIAIVADAVGFGALPGSTNWRLAKDLRDLLEPDRG